MPLSRPSGDATSGLRAWCITLIVVASTQRSATLSGSVKSVPEPRSALRVIPTTTPWLKRPSDCSKLNCWISARSPGVDWRAWSSLSSATSTGSTPVASTIRSAAFHQQSSKQPTTTNTMNAANYNWTEPINRPSDKPGEIQPSPLPNRLLDIPCKGLGGAYITSGKLTSRQAYPNKNRALQGPVLERVISKRHPRKRHRQRHHERRDQQRNALSHLFSPPSSPRFPFPKTKTGL